MKTFNIGGTDVPMLSNAATAIVHQRIFNEDLLTIYNKEFSAKKKGQKAEISGEFLAVLKRQAYTMAMQAEHVGQEAKLMTLSEVDFVKWLCQFPSMAMEEVVADVMTYYTEGDTPTAEEKKEIAPQTDQ